MLFSFATLIYIALIKSSSSASSYSTSIRPSTSRQRSNDDPWPQVILEYFGLSPGSGSSSGSGGSSSSSSSSSDHPANKSTYQSSYTGASNLEEVLISIDRQKYSQQPKQSILKSSTSRSLGYHFSKTSSKTSLPSSQSTMITGKIVEVEPTNACAPVTITATTTTNPSFAKIIPLITSDGSCTVREQIRNILKLPYNISAILLLTPNHKAGIYEIDLSSISGTIPPILTLSPSSSIAESLFHYMKEPSSLLTLSHWAKYAHQSSPFFDTEINGELVILSILLVIICCLFVSIIFQWKQLRRQQRLANQRRLQQRQILVVDKAFISKLPLRTFSSSGIAANSDGGNHTVINISQEQQHPSYDTCPICLDDFEDGDQLRELPCGHDYHQDCIHPWLEERSVLCPMCKEDVRDTHVVVSSASGTSSTTTTSSLSSSDSESPDVYGASGARRISTNRRSSSLSFFRRCYRKMRRFWRRFTKKLLRFLINEAAAPVNTTTTATTTTTTTTTIVHRSPTPTIIRTSRQTEYSLPRIR